MRRGTLSCLVLGVLSIPAGAEAPRVQQSDRRDRMFPELVVESGGRRSTCDALTFTRDGKHLLAVGDDKVVRVWDCRDGQVVPESMKTLRWSVWGPQRGAIYALAVSPDPEGRCVAIGGLGMKTTAAAVIDRRTGEILITIYPIDHPAAPKKKGGFQAVRAIAFSPGGERIAFGSDDGSVWLWLWRPEGKGKEELRWLGEHSRQKSGLNRIRLLHFLNEKNLLSVAQNGEMFQWDLGADTQEPNRLNLFQDVGGPIHDVLFSPDRKWLAARAMSKPFIYVRSFDGKQRKDIELEEGAVASSLAFSLRGQLAASIRSLQKHTGGFHLESEDQIRLYDLSAETARASKGPPHSGPVDFLTFHPDDHHIAVAGGDNHEVTLWDLNCPQARPTELCGMGSGIWELSLSEEENGRYLAFRTQRNPAATHPNRRGRNPWTVFDLKLQNWPERNRFTPSPKLEETPDGWQVKPTKDDYIWCVKQKGTTIQHELPWNRSWQMMPRCYAFLPRAEGEPARLAVGHYYGVSIFEVTKEGARRIWQGVGHEGRVMALAISAKGDWLVSASDDQTISAWSLRDWPCGSELGARFASDENGQVFVSKVDPFSPAWEAGLVEKDKVMELKIGRDLIFRCADRKGQEPQVGTVDACLKALETVEPGKSLSFRIHRGADEWITNTSVWRRPLWRFFPTRNKEWVLWMGQHPYYETSNNGDKYIGWQMNNKDDLKKTPSFYPAEQFRKLFHKPRVIDKLLSERDIGQALDESRAGLKPPNFNKLFDSVSVRIEPHVQAVDAKDDLKVTLDIQPRIQNPDYMPVRAELWINDHRLEVWKNLEGKPLRIDKYTIKRNKLRQGDNDLTLQCYNNVEGRGEGRLEASARVRCNRAASKPSLHGFVVGIKDYSQAAHYPSGEPRLENLRTPIRDMEAIRQAWLIQRGGKLYSNVDISLLTEKEGKTDRQSILKHFQKLAKTVGPDDQVFVFLAGHGTVLDPEGKRNFVFCCPDYDPDKPGTYISAYELYEKLADIPCRKMVFLDVCHSGEVVRPVRDLTPGGRGPIILAACDRGESSWEPPQFLREEARSPKPGSAKPGADLKPRDAKGAMAENNSFFVAALLEAFQDERADQNGDGLLDAYEIYDYTSNRVPELLKQANLKVAQNPTWSPPASGRNALLALSSPSRK
jgi:WD40 repeat protein